MSDRPGSSDDTDPAAAEARDAADAAQRHPSAHPERIERTWPQFEQGEEKPVTELAAEHQGAEAPFGSDVHPPIDLAEYRRNTGRGRPADDPS